jgi:hypothetical protein
VGGLLRTASVNGNLGVFTAWCCRIWYCGGIAAYCLVRVILRVMVKVRITVEVSLGVMEEMEDMEEMEEMEGMEGTVRVRARVRELEIR